MAWQPRWQHVSQLFHHSGDGTGVVEGANDCFEASLSRYLRETGYQFAGDDAALVAAVRLQVTGAPDHAGQGFTWLSQVVAGLGSFGIAYRFTSALDEARAAPWAVLWVRAGRCRLAQPLTVDGLPRWTAYPPAWLAGEPDTPDHFILKMPNGQINDPLAYWCGDVSYSATSLASAFVGAYILQSPARGSVPQPAPAAPTPPASPPAPAQAPAAHDLVVTAPAGLRLREAPTLEAPILATLVQGETVADVYAADCLWRFVRAHGLHGWVRREYVRVTSG